MQLSWVHPLRKSLIGPVLAAALLASSSAHATWPVFDYTNFIQNTITAAQALKTEVYENTNVLYQYKMMLNQLQQAVGLDAITHKVQEESILADVKRYADYGQVLEQLYGSVSGNADYLSRINSLVVQSGKTSSQWFEDQRTLFSGGDKTAKALFDAGSDVANNIARLAKRRQDLQSQMTRTPTAEATAQTTNQYLDVLASQNADLIRLVGAKAQSDAIKDRKENAESDEKNTAMQSVLSSQDAQLQSLRQSVYSRDYSSK
ncbi:conjugal transfer protein TrbJ [Ralstonia nicotianae]|uniref:conjugal transfer protein TrbJ n=1 Tax=Ralstonia pseudosolanacearum TaxID=1310165 RepID=UPI002004B77D|nr:conjugal transfer protein TrbJ [Ralstonia pseudosolanacearum]MCK4118410.1 conjugal transfer protein TrbJ [Ralstonia pseudosolanacearum]